MLFRPWNMLCNFTVALSAVCSVQYGRFLQFLNFVLSRYVAQVMSEWFWNGSSCTQCTDITFAFTFHMRCISIMMSLLLLLLLLLLSSSSSSSSPLCSVFILIFLTQHEHEGGAMGNGLENIDKCRKVNRVKGKAKHKSNFANFKKGQENETSVKRGG